MNKRNIKDIETVVNHFLPKYIEKLAVVNAESTIIKISSELNILKSILANCSLKINQKDFLELRDLIMSQKNKDGNLLVITSRTHMLRRVKLFFEFCGKQKGMKQIIKEEFINQLQPTLKQLNEKRTYEVRRNKPPSLDEVMKLLEVDLDNPDITQRARAILISLAFAGIRHSSLKSLPIKCLETDNRLYPYFNLAPSEKVDVKMGKNIKPGFLVPKKEYYMYLINYKANLLQLGFVPEDALFGRTKSQRDENKNFSRKETILTKEFIQGKNSINKLLKEMCYNAGLSEVYTAHSFRHFFAKYSKDHVKTIKEFQALAKSTGHNNMRQLLSEYGKVSMEESLDILLEIQNRIFNEQISNKENDIVSALAKYYGEEHAFKLKKIV